MNPLLKQHIERYIEDIEQGDLTNSIIQCPLDIMSDYLNTLRMIDVVIPGHLIPFTRVSCYLASVLPYGMLFNIEIRSAGNETYEFFFPYSNIDSQQLNNGIINSCPCHYVHNDFSVDYYTQTVTIKVSIGPASKFMF